MTLEQVLKERGEALPDNLIVGGKVYKQNGKRFYNGKI